MQNHNKQTSSKNSRQTHVSEAFSKLVFLIKKRKNIPAIPS